jgi:N-acetylglucosamine-6-phosphate deacetylase
MLPRLDNYILRQLGDDRLAASFIADGHHIPFPVLRSFLRAKGIERSVLITDAIPAADKGPGIYMLGGEEIHVGEDLRCAKPGASNLAGSALTLDHAVLHVAKHCGIQFEKVWEMASVRPADLVGLSTPKEVTVTVGDDGFRVQPG